MSKIREWLLTTPYKNYTIEASLADASFRKYYRLRDGEKTALLMDSSLELNSLKSFIDITARLCKTEVGVPKIFEEDLQNGYLIIEDFGGVHYLDVLNQDNFKAFYTKAINTILKMQKADVNGLPLYDKEFLHVEMNLMQEWYIEQLLHVKLSDSQKKLIAKALEAISTVVLEQPQDVFVHRDFHSRNIMLKNDKKIGIIDYQDAMNGAITYDLVSLLKDCYVAYERKEIKKLALEFRDKKGLKVDDETFIKWFDFMGMQRHIKVLGIFSRLNIRDKKSGYLKDIPLTLKYVIDTASRYNETKRVGKFIKQYKMNAMILAAGRGERMRPLTDKTPKPLLKVHGKPLIVWHIEKLASLGFSEIVINVDYLGDKIIQALGDGSEWGVSIIYSDERETGALESGGGIIKALPFMGDETFLVVNSDIWCDYEFDSNFDLKDDLAHLILVSNPQHNPEGDFGLNKDTVTNDSNKKYTFSGIGYYCAKLFENLECKKTPLAPILREAAQNKKVSGSLYLGEWRDIGTPQRLKEIQN